jgi:hypothetical protein
MVRLPELRVDQAQVVVRVGVSRKQLQRTAAVANRLGGVSVGPSRSKSNLPSMAARKLTKSSDFCIFLSLFLGLPPDG